MALNRLRFPVTQVTKRRFSVQQAACPDESSAADVITTVIPNKLIVSSLDLNGPLSRVSVAFRVGSRHENEKNQGIVHVIRSLAGFGTQKCTGFAIWKNSQYNGVHFYCTGDREMTAFHAVGARTKISATLKYFAAMTSLPAFKPWEITDNLPRLKYEIKGQHPCVKVMEMLHKAAFRTGLGNSLYVEEDFIGMHTSEMLDNFYKSGFTANRGSLIGYNMTQKDMLEFAKNLELCSNDLPDGNGKYFGGEVRQNINSYFAHVAIATQSCGIKNLKDSLSFLILQHIYGVQPVIIWGGSPSLVYKATYPVAPEVGASCFSAAYSDNGLFGVIISGPAQTAGKALLAAHKVLKSGSISEADFKRGKAMVKANMLYNAENTGTVMENMCQQTLQQGVVVPESVIVEAVEKINFSDVLNVAKKVAGGKFSIAAYGNLTEIPYLDDLQ